MNQQPQDVPLQMLNPNVSPHQGPMVNLMAPSVSSPYGGNDQSWKHFLTNIPPAVSNKLTIIGVLYIIIGILNIILEFVLIFRAVIGLFGAFANGLLLLITGVVTLVLCRQQIYTLTSIFVLAIAQLHVTIVVLGVYIYFTPFIFDEVRDCTWSYSTCYRYNTAAGIVVVDILHFLFTIGLVIITLIIIKNARQLPTIPVAVNYAPYNPQAQAMPAVFHNPNAVALN